MEIKADVNADFYLNKVQASIITRTEKARQNHPCNKRDCGTYEHKRSLTMRS